MTQKSILLQELSELTNCKYAKNSKSCCLHIGTCSVCLCSSDTGIEGVSRGYGSSLIACCENPECKNKLENFFDKINLCEKQLIELFDNVKVKRSSGIVENNWKPAKLVLFDYGVFNVTVRKGRLEKDIELFEFIELNFNDKN